MFPVLPQKPIYHGFESVEQSYTSCSSQRDALERLSQATEGNTWHPGSIEQAQALCVLDLSRRSDLPMHEDLVKLNAHRFIWNCTLHCSTVESVLHPPRYPAKVCGATDLRECKTNQKQQRSLASRTELEPENGSLASRTWRVTFGDVNSIHALHTQFQVPICSNHSISTTRQATKSNPLNAWQDHTRHQRQNAATSASQVKWCVASEKKRGTA